MTPRRAALLVGGALLTALELLVVRAYLVRGTTWHWLLHGAIGLGLGLSAAAAVAAVRRRPTAPVPWAVAGQLVSIAPDLLFVFGREPHRPWMDVFVGHIAIHTAPGPLFVGLAVFVLGGWAWWLAAAAGRREAGLALAGTAAAVIALALLLHEPIPDSLSDYRDPAAAAWWCGEHPA